MVGTAYLWATGLKQLAQGLDYLRTALVTWLAVGSGCWLETQLGHLSSPLHGQLELHREWRPGSKKEHFKGVKPEIARFPEA